MEGVQQGMILDSETLDCLKKTYPFWKEFDKEMILDSWDLDCFPKKTTLYILEGGRQGDDFRCCSFRLFKNALSILEGVRQDGLRF